MNLDCGGIGRKFLKREGSPMMEKERDDGELK